MTVTETKIEFWIELWEDLIDNFLKSSFGLNLYSPHILIDDIISEIEENGFKNPDNKKYFYYKVSFYLENDIVVKNDLCSQFKILRRIFNSDRTNYILETSKEIRNVFQNGLYFENSLNHLSDLLTDDKEISIEFVNTINYFTQSLIVELIKKSYSLEDIKKFPRNIFDNYSFVRETTDILTTQFPHGIDYKKYKNEIGEINREKYNNDIIELISKLSEKDRIKRLSFYYNKKKEIVQYIFVIEGLKGEIEAQIGDVTFYSLTKRRFVTENNKEIDFEELQRHQRKEKYIQAAVKVEYLMPKSTHQEAIIKLENSLDIISCYFNFKAELNFNDSNYIIVNSDGRSIYSSMGRDKRDSVLKYHDSLNLNEIEEHFKEINDYNFLWSKSGRYNKSVPKIINALHWYRKAEQSVKQEDKMLNYWISIESLFNLEKDIRLDVLNDSSKSKFHLIQETVASTQVFVFVYDFGWELYNYYSSIVDNPFNNVVQIPNELIQKAQLKPKLHEKIYLKNFIDNLEEIKNYEKNLFVLDKINIVKNFYFNSNETKKIVEEQINLIKNDVLMIYRFRNLIVHNAFFDNTLLPYLVWKIKKYSGYLIRRLISEYNDEKDLSDLLIDIHFKREKFLQDFENGKVNLFKD